MNFTLILEGIAVLGAMGAIFGALLAFAAKIFQIHDVASISEWLESGKYIESKYTWNA